MFTNPRTVPTLKTVKYCTRPEPEAEVTTEPAIERLRLRPGSGGQRQRPVQSLVPPAQQEIQVRDNTQLRFERHPCVHILFLNMWQGGIIVDNVKHFSQYFSYKTSCYSNTLHYIVYLRHSDKP